MRSDNGDDSRSSKAIIAEKWTAFSDVSGVSGSERDRGSVGGEIEDSRGSESERESGSNGESDSEGEVDGQSGSERECDGQSGSNGESDSEGEVDGQSGSERECDGQSGSNGESDSEGEVDGQSGSERECDGQSGSNGESDSEGEGDGQSGSERDDDSSRVRERARGDGHDDYGDDGDADDYGPGAHAYGRHSDTLSSDCPDSDDSGDASSSTAIKSQPEKQSDLPSTKHFPVSEDSPPQFVRRHKRRLKMLPEQLRRAAESAKAKNIKTTLPQLGRYHFDNFEDFKKLWAEYVAANYAKYRFRHSLTRVAKNRDLKKNHPRKAKKAQARGRDCDLHLIPDHLSYFELTAQCIHGCAQASRSTGQRFPAATRYTECPATIHAKATRHEETGEWDVTVSNENTEHNHTLDKTVYNSYQTSSEIEEADLFKEIVAMVEADGSTKLICDRISRRLGRTFTSRQLHNWKQYRLGGKGALSRLKILLRKFAAADGSRVLVMKNEEGILSGIALQSRVQQKLFERWGDSLLFDFTHNTNNLGFYMGSLMVTTANRKGVSILDFLCVRQTKAMMRAVLQQFVEWNPSALTKIKSIVIDKDYREWDVLEEIFTESEVLLCQFHVLKWFKHVVTQAKYNLSATKRETVLTILRAMVYAPSEDAFLHQRMLLLQFLGSEHGNFIAYMRDYWYNCTKMWSYAGRGKVFTAANTTTNRLESFWNQYKESLGRKRRIDYCVERIFVHATAVLRREKRLLSDFLTKTKLQPRVPLFLAPLVNDLSEYATDLVVAQYNKYASNSSNYSSVSIGSSKYAVRIVGTRTVVVAVDNQRWECSCSFFKGSSLPCRHLMHIASDIDLRHKYPLEGLSPRWSLTAATSLMDELHRSVEEVSNLRSGVWSSGQDVVRGEDDQGVQSDQLDSIDALAAAHQTGERPRRLPAVAFLTVRRGEGRDCDLVMTD